MQRLSATWWSAASSASLASQQQLARRLIGMGSDGAAVMTGCHTGLAVRLRETAAPSLLSIHCVAHRLSLLIDLSTLARSLIVHLNTGGCWIRGSFAPRPFFLKAVLNLAVIEKNGFWRKSASASKRKKKALQHTPD